MGLWGLFTMMFGLGVVAKDAISDSIDDVKQSSIAERKGKPVYWVNGRIMKSTKTGRECNYDKLDDNHLWVVDRKTKEKIEDITAQKNREKTAINKREAFAKGYKFYRTAEFDGACGAWSDIYVCDDYPGKYFSESNCMDYGLVKHEKVYSEGEVKDFVNKRKHVATYWDDRKFECYEDGTVRTKEYITKNKNNLTRSNAIKDGNKYYFCMEDPDWQWRDVETNELIYHDYKLDYYTKGKIVEKQVQAKPHHAEMKIVYEVVEVPGETRYNLDGSLWIE